MNSKLSNLIDEFASLNVLVVGDAILDCYLEGETKRLCREAPVPVVDIEARRNMAGGAANTAVNLASLGAQTYFLSVCGDDAAGDEIFEILNDYGVATENVLRVPARATLTKKRVVSGAQMLVRFDEGTGTDLDELTEKRFLERLEQLFPLADAVVISDYDYGVLTARVVEKLRELQTANPRLLMVDSRRLPFFRSTGAIAVKPNFAETCELLGASPADYNLRADFVVENAERVLEITGARVAAVTLDSEGAIILEHNRPAHRTYTPPRKFASATGAGDTFTSAFALALAAGAHAPAAAELASAAAALVIEKTRTAVCAADELRDYVIEEDKTVLSLSRLAAKVRQYRRQNQKIVFTNGCFDILHRGHIAYLNQAKALGDVLIVGVNADDSVRRLKQPARPINPLDDRLEVLSALSCVDHLIQFETDSPVEIIETLRPDVYVKGGDYTLETLPETDLIESIGGEIVILPYLEDRSTTGVIERIRRAYDLAS